MIKYKTGNIFKEDVEAIVNTVNCVGVMGRGIALQFKKNFPANYNAYVAACERQEIKPGKIFVYETGQLTNPHFIMNFPTKRHWKNKSDIEDIEIGLVDLIKEIRDRNIKSIAIPPLGSGLGGLNWAEVRSRIEKAFQDFGNLNIIVFEPLRSTSTIAESAFDRCKMTAGRAALVSLIDRYLNGLIDPFISLLELHKLMYFMQEAGEPLRLQYKKAAYGPYAENLRHVLRTLENTYIAGYGDGGDQPDKKIELLEGALTEATSFLERQSVSQTRNHLEKVSELVNGFESSFGLELLSTVHWVVKKEHAKSLNEVIDKVYAWNDRKKQFSERQINIAYNALNDKSWIL